MRLFCEGGQTPATVIRREEPNTIALPGGGIYVFAVARRRRLIEEPMSRTAVWARRLALFALVASLLSIIIVRSGVLEVRPALVTFAGALGFAVAAIVLAFAAFVVIWREGTRRSRLGAAGAFYRFASA